MMKKGNVIADIQSKIDEIREQQYYKEEAIEENYNREKEELEEENQKLSNLMEKEIELIEEYSIFKNVGRFMTVLADITSLYMAEEYYWGINDDVPTLIPKDMDNSDQLICFYDEYNQSEDYLKFYKYDGDVDNGLFQYTIFESDNLEKYDFLKKFVDYVISYKFEVSKVNLSSDVLRKLEKEFVLSNIDEIKKINEDVSRLCIKEQKDITSDREKRLNKILEKYIKGDNY